MREGRIDSLKGVLIALVVFGHCFLYGVPQDNVKMVVANYVYLFHMPFFVFLSGYFTHVQSKSFWKGMLFILESYVVFQLIKGFFQGYTVTEYLTIPAPMMWYLWALLIWRLVSYLLSRLKLSITANYIILALLFIFGLLTGFIDGIGKPFALSRLIVFAPFFWLGYLLSGKDFISFCKRMPKWLAVIVLVLPALLVTLLTPSETINVREIVRGASGYGGESINLLARICLYALAILMSISITSLVTESKLLSEVGRASLKYYLFHGIALSAMVFLKLYWPWYMAIVYGGVLMVIFYFFNKTKLSDFAIRPVSFIVVFFKYGKSSNNSN